jgi:hypothetical protein
MGGKKGEGSVGLWEEGNDEGAIRRAIMEARRGVGREEGRERERKEGEKGKKIK